MGSFFQQNVKTQNFYNESPNFIDDALQVSLGVLWAVGTFVGAEAAGRAALRAFGARWPAVGVAVTPPGALPRRPRGLVGVAVPAGVCLCVWVARLGVSFAVARACVRRGWAPGVASGGWSWAVRGPLPLRAPNRVCARRCRRGRRPFGVGLRGRRDVGVPVLVACATAPRNVSCNFIGFY